MHCKSCQLKETRTKRAHYCEDCHLIARREACKKHHLLNRENRNISCREYKNKNKQKIKEYNKKYNSDNSIILSEKRREKRLENSEYLNEKSIEWRKNNKDKVREYNKIHTPLYRKKYPWIQACRNIIYNTLKRIGLGKEGKTIELLGYSAYELKINIESKFEQGMSWNNYGEWHIDHIRPISDFEKDTPISIINSLCNLQPLWKIDNLKKGKKTSFYY